MIANLQIAAAWLGLLTSVWLVVFQVVLAAGAPLGFLAWGGQEPGRLSPVRRWASAVSAILMVGFALLFGQAAGLWAAFPDPLPRWPFWAGMALFALSILGNMSSQSRPERLLGVPVTIAMTAACAVMAIWPPE